jgi:hypothetical protein
VEVWRSWWSRDRGGLEVVGVWRSCRHGAAESWRPTGMEVVEAWRRGVEVCRHVGMEVRMEGLGGVQACRQGGPHGASAPAIFSGKQRV